MGNILAGGLGPAPPAQPQPALVLEEDEQGRSLLTSRLNRAQAGNPQLRRILSRSGTAAAVCAAINGGAGGAGGSQADGYNALHIAAATGWEELVRKLLEAGALSVDSPSREGYTALHLAAMCGRAGIVRCLLDHGAQLSRRSRRGHTAISFAAQAPGNLEALRACLAHPSCSPQLVRQLGYRQRSPLVLAVLAHGNGPVVRALLGSGANASETCAAMAGVSVLHTCAHLARVDAMRELIAAGANTNAAAEDGISVLQELFVQAPSRHRPETVKRQMFRMLVDAGANVNSRVPDRDYTVLHFALASCEEEETANMLLDAGIDVGIAINTPVRMHDAASKNTLLHLAAEHGWLRMTERLLAAGADLTLSNADGLEPLHAAILGCNHRTVAVLLAAGADPRSECPDVYPSFARWKLQRGLQAMHALMQAEDGAGADMMTALAAALDPEAEGAPRMTAVDLACCVARDIPTLEAFVERGVAPSEEALALAEHSIPIMRAVVERPLLTPALAARLPPRFRRSARELLLCLSRPVRVGSRRGGRQVVLSPDAVATILQQAAFPVSQWAEPAWLAAQRVRPPPLRPAPAGAAGNGNAGQQPQGGQGAGAAAAGAAAGLPPGFHVIQPGEEAPPLVQAVMQQVQQQLGMPPGAQPAMVIMHQPGGPLGGPPPGGAPAGAAGQGPGAGAGAAQLLPGGGQGMQFFMQFQVPLDGPMVAGAGGQPGGGGPGAAAAAAAAAGGGPGAAAGGFGAAAGGPGGPGGAAMGAADAVMQQMMQQIMGGLLGGLGLPPLGMAPPGLFGGMGPPGAGAAGGGAAAGAAPGMPAGGPLGVPMFGGLFDFGDEDEDGMFGFEDEEDEEDDEEGMGQPPAGGAGAGGGPPGMPPLDSDSEAEQDDDDEEWVPPPPAAAQHHQPPTQPQPQAAPASAAARAGPSRARGSAAAAAAGPSRANRRASGSSGQAAGPSGSRAGGSKAAGKRPASPEEPPAGGRYNLRDRSKRSRKD